MPDAKRWNPRYVAYAKAHGKTPEAMLRADKFERPCGCMVGFLEWNSQKLREFRVARPEAFFGTTLSDHAAYDAWLAEKAGGADGGWAASTHPSWIAVVRMYRGECGLSFEQAKARANREFTERGWEVPQMYRKSMETA